MAQIQSVNKPSWRCLFKLKMNWIYSPAWLLFIKKEVSPWYSNLNSTSLEHMFIPFQRCIGFELDIQVVPEQNRTYNNNICQRVVCLVYSSQMSSFRQNNLMVPLYTVCYPPINLVYYYLITLILYKLKLHYPVCIFYIHELFASISNNWSNVWTICP